MNNQWLLIKFSILRLFNKKKILILIPIFLLIVYEVSISKIPFIVTPFDPQFNILFQIERQLEWVTIYIILPLLIFDGFNRIVELIPPIISVRLINRSSYVLANFFSLVIISVIYSLMYIVLPLIIMNKPIYPVMWFIAMIVSIVTIIVIFTTISVLLNNNYAMIVIVGLVILGFIKNSTFLVVVTDFTPNYLMNLLVCNLIYIGICLIAQLIVINKIDVI